MDMDEPERTETHTESERAEEQKIRDRKKQKNAVLSSECSVLDPIELDSGLWTGIYTYWALAFCVCLCRFRRPNILVYILCWYAKILQIAHSLFLFYT